LAGDVVALGHHLRGLDHRHVHLGLVLVQPGLVDAGVVAVLGLREAHWLRAASGHDGHAVHDDALGRHGDGLHAGGAEPVPRPPGRGHREAGAQRGLARDVLTGGALGERAAQDHVLHLAGRDARALHGAGDHVAGEGGAVGIVEGAPVGTADGSARGRDDDGFCHGDLLYRLFTGPSCLTRRAGARSGPVPSVTRFDDSGPPGPPVRGWLHRPAAPHGAGLVLAHGAGGNADALVLVEMATAFADAGWTVLRCDLPF